MATVLVIYAILYAIYIYVYISAKCVVGPHIADVMLAVCAKQVHIHMLLEQRTNRTDGDFATTNTISTSGSYLHFGVCACSMTDIVRTQSHIPIVYSI